MVGSEGVGDVRFWAVYVPVVPVVGGVQPPEPSYVQQRRVGLRCGQPVFAGDPLLVVVSCPAHLSVARSVREAGSEVVVWAWLCSEVLARQAETEFPVLYGIPTAGEVVEAAVGGLGEQPVTGVCLNVESAFSIPEILSHT